MNECWMTWPLNTTASGTHVVETVLNGEMCVALIVGGVIPFVLATYCLLAYASYVRHEVRPLSRSALFVPAERVRFDTARRQARRRFLALLRRHWAIQHLGAVVVAAWILLHIVAAAAFELDNFLVWSFLAGLGYSSCVIGAFASVPLLMLYFSGHPVRERLLPAIGTLITVIGVSAVAYYLGP